MASVARLVGRRLVSFEHFARSPKATFSVFQRGLCSTSDGNDMSRLSEFESLAVKRPRPFVVQVELNRPKKMNAMNRAFWKEMVECFNLLVKDEDCRSVVLTGAGKNYTAGLDLMDFAELFSADESGDVGRRALRLRSFICEMQETFSVIERCPKPVVAAIHGACVGGGIDMITACDVRYCSKDAWFQIKEVEIGLAADVGTLQRLPKIVGNDSVVRELAYTAARFSADRALEMGLVSRVLEDVDATQAAALDLASSIAEKSPIAVQGTKINLNYSRNYPTDRALDYMSVWNASMLQSEDLTKAATAQLTKEKPIFAKL